ncbi:hypothetical protein [Kribbella sindirgiensis]|uniref:Uncharacterized protein n=1 Tax=Kribbella sindirgiensis TaxID=1124744 RepID=A0A4R0I241_9ACTN|nr:hypothetical protein [Kribbella sindirgiensis]TCC19944.1 hypothetical protein E0H50_37575 [Kribbella sindirgiensis]
MDYTIKPSKERPDALKHPEVTLAIFLETFDGYTLRDLGPHLTCTEAEALAELLESNGRYEQADALRMGHIESDDIGDTNHNTGDGFKYGDAELLEVGDDSFLTDDPRLIGTYVEDALWQRR